MAGGHRKGFDLEVSLAMWTLRALHGPLTKTIVSRQGHQLGKH